MGFDTDEIRNEIDEEVGSVPWVSAAIIGVSYLFVAFVAVPILMVLDLLLISPDNSIVPDFDSGSAFVQALVWSFYNAHAVPITGGTTNLNLIEVLDGGLPTTAYYLVPALASFMGGRSIARSNGHKDMSNESLGALGAMMVVGYGGLMFLGVFLSEWHGVAPATGEGSSSPRSASRSSSGSSAATSPIGDRFRRSDRWSDRSRGTAVRVAPRRLLRPSVPSPRGVSVPF